MSNWQIIIPIIVRQMIGDTGLTQQYSDQSLQSLISVAGVMLNREVDFSYEYTIDVANVAISPDPVDVNDVNFIGLVCLKTCVFIADGEYRNSAKFAISHRDGPSHIDAKNVAENFKTIAVQRAQQYFDARRQYQIGDGTLGCSIIGPYNAFISPYATNITSLNTGANRDDTASFFSGG